MRNFTKLAAILLFILSLQVAKGQNPNYKGFELNNKYYEIAKNRINKHILDNNLQDRYNLIT